MKIIIAPDSFKGSISAVDLCHAIHKGISKVMPKADVIEVPLSDGGEGMVENLVMATNGEIKHVLVSDPIGRKVKAYYGVLGNGKTAVIEMAQASGLTLLEENERNPLLASSYGTGEMILHALNQGYRDFIIGLGGSATNDAGTGMLRALGIELLDEKRQPIADGGGSLDQLEMIEMIRWDSRIQESTFTIASDVTNFLCGEHGASAVFGPQKGATSAQVRILDDALFHFAEVIHNYNGIDTRIIQGGGAAGGMGAAFSAFFNAELKPGIELLMQTIEFNEKLAGVDLIITGEGRLDEQTLSGKVVAGVCKQARGQHIPVIALCGSLSLEADQMDELGILAAYSVVPGPCSLDQAFNHAAEWAEETTEQIFRVIRHSFG